MKLKRALVSDECFICVRARIFVKRFSKLCRLIFNYTYIPINVFKWHASFTHLGLVISKRLEQVSNPRHCVNGDNIVTSY